MSSSQSNSPSPSPEPVVPKTKKVVKKKPGLKFKAKQSQVVQPSEVAQPSPEPTPSPPPRDAVDEVVDAVCPPVEDKRYALKGKNRWSRFFESQAEMEAFDGADGTGYYLKGQTASCCGKVFRKKYPKGLHYKTCDGTIKRCGNDGYTFVGGVCRRIDGTRRRGNEPDWVVGITKKFKALKIDSPLDDSHFQTLDEVKRFITDPEAFAEHYDSFERLISECELFEDEFKAWVEGHSDITSTTKTLTTDGFTGQTTTTTTETKSSFRDYISKCLEDAVSSDALQLKDDFISKYFE